MILSRLTLQVLPVELEWYVSLKLDFEVIDENTLDANCKDIWVCKKNIKTSKKSLVASIYRRPSSNTTSFVQALNNKIADLDISNYNAPSLFAWRFQS